MNKPKEYCFLTNNKTGIRRNIKDIPIEELKEICKRNGLGFEVVERNHLARKNR